MVKGKSYSKVHHLSRSLKKIGKGLGRKSIKSVAFQVMKHKQLRSRILKVLGTSIQIELKKMCDMNKPSILRSNDPVVVQSFKWQVLINELKENVPTLYNILACCARKKPMKQGKKSYRVKDEVVIGICASVLLRHRNCKLNLIQRIVSMILYSNHAGKMVG